MHLLAFVLPGMTIGFLSFGDGGPMSHDLIARTPALALRIPMKEVRRLSMIRPQLMQAFQAQVAERLRTLYDALIYSKTFSLRERVITQLVMLADRGSPTTALLRDIRTHVVEGVLQDGGSHP